MPTASAQKSSSPKQSQPKKAKRFMVLEKLFRTPPVQYKAKDGTGRKVIVEHRIGAKAGSFRKTDLMYRTKLEKEWQDLYNKYQNRLRDRKEFERIMDSCWKTQCDKLQKLIRSYRTYLEKFYVAQRLFPLFAYVPIDGSDEMGLYIQALVDVETEALVAGDANDVALWTEVTQVRTLPIKKRNDMSLRIAKQLMKLPGVNKDIQHRMKLVVTGNLPTNIKLIGKTSDDD